jgi:hypothetical protein
LAILAWVLTALALGITLPLEGRAQQPPLKPQVSPPATTPQTTGTSPQGRSSTPPAVAATSGRGDQRPGRRPDWLWWQDDSVQKELALSPQQVRSIDQLYQRRERDMKAIVAEWEKHQDELDRMSREAAVTYEEFRNQVIKVQAFQSELSVSRIVMVYRMNQQLTAEQRAKLPGIRDRHFNRGRGGGF